MIAKYASMLSGGNASSSMTISIRFAINEPHPRTGKFYIEYSWPRCKLYIEYGAAVGRPKQGMKTISVQIPPKLIERLARIRKILGISKSEVIRQGTEKQATELEKQIKKPK